MATETFTLTLDNAPTESVSVTINDTSLTPSGEQSYTTPGVYTFTVPTGVTSLDIYMVGGGGGGSVGEYSNGSPGGGGGGAVIIAEGFSVTPGDTFNVSVGAGGTRGSCSTNSPFEIVTTTYSSGSSKFPQAGTITSATSGGSTVVTHNPSNTTATAGYGEKGTIVAGGVGGNASVTTGFSSRATNVTTINGTAGSTGTSGNSGRFPGGGGGAGEAGNGGNGRGEFYRSSGGFNYYKAGSGGNGGGAYLYGSYTATANGSNSPALVTSTSPLQLNYNGGSPGFNTGTVTGGSYGAGGGAGAGGQIRAQTIISGGTNYYYFWYLAGVGQAGGDGAVRFSWGA